VESLLKAVENKKVFTSYGIMAQTYTPCPMLKQSGAVCHPANREIRAETENVFTERSYDYTGYSRYA
jgi:hypothetical protein